VVFHIIGEGRVRVDVVDLDTDSITKTESIYPCWSGGYFATIEIKVEEEASYNFEVTNESPEAIVIGISFRNFET